MVGVVAHVGTGWSAIDPSVRGYNVLFRANENNRCPGCGRAQWLVGRVTAECVFCGTALPLAEARWGDRGATRHQNQIQPSDEAISRADERRRHARLPGGGRFVTLLVDGSPRAFSAYNFSAGGVLLRPSPDLAAATSVEVVARSGEIVRAELRWNGADAAGLQFAKPLALELSPVAEAS